MFVGQQALSEHLRPCPPAACGAAIFTERLHGDGTRHWAGISWGSAGVPGAPEPALGRFSLVWAGNPTSSPPNKA